MPSKYRFKDEDSFAHIICTPDIVSGELVDVGVYDDERVKRWCCAKCRSSDFCEHIIQGISLFPATQRK